MMYFSCDVGKFLNSDRGLLDVKNYDYESLMGTVSYTHLELQGRFKFACKDNGFCRFNKNKNTGSFQIFQIFGVNRTIKFDLF